MITLTVVAVVLAAVVALAFMDVARAQAKRQLTTGGQSDHVAVFDGDASADCGDAGGADCD